MTKKLLKTFQFILLLALVGGNLLSPVVAQMFGDPHTKVQIMVEKSVLGPGESLRGVFHMTMEDGWHTYWKNAGDVGLPTEVNWKLPEGWTAEPLMWPAPEYLDTSGLISYAYEHQVSIPFVLKPPTTPAPEGLQTMKATLSWLECQEACIPGEAELVFSVEVGTSPTEGPEATKVREAFEALPTERDDILVSRDGQFLKLHIPAELGGPESTFRFFPAAAEMIQASAPQELLTDETGARSLKLQTDTNAEKATEELSGLLVSTQGEARQAFSFKAKVLADAPIPPQPASAGTILFTLGLAFLGGMVLNLMPCVFPVLSLKVLGIVEQSREEGRKAWHHGAVFTLGVLVSFWALSGLLLIVRAAGEEVGWGYHLQNPVMIAFLAALFLLIGLNLFGVFEVGENLTQLSNVADKKHGFSHSFWSGVLTTLAATPCTAPFMGGAVGFALSQSAAVALLVFTALALGVAAPYMTLTLFPRLLEKLPRPGAWMITFKQILAFPMLLAVVWLVWVFGGQVGSDRMAMLLLALVVLSFASWVYGKWGTSYVDKTRRMGMVASLLVTVAAISLGYQASREDPGAELWQPYSPALVEQLVSEGKPVFLDFTADWCTSCKANELLTLSRSDVTETFQDLGVTLVKGDWTKKDPVITAALAQYGRAGVPLYVLYPGEGREPVLLPEVLLPGMVLDALKEVKKAK